MPDTDESKEIKRYYAYTRAEMVRICILCFLLGAGVMVLLVAGAR